MPTAWDLTNFEGTNGSRALKVKIDYREIMAELLDKHLQIPWKSDSPLQDKHINKVFDGLSAYTRRGLV